MKDAATDPVRSRFPRKLTLLTLLAIAIVFVFHWQQEQLNESFGFWPSTPWIVTLVVGMLVWSLWWIWSFAFLRGGKGILLGLTIILIPVLFLTLYAPDFGGNASFTRFRPRFWQSRDTNFVDPVANSSNVDLTPVSEIDFAQFLGPNRDVRVTAVSLADEWPEQLEPMWKQNVGDAWSGFVAVNGYAITQEQRGNDECVSCFDIETGEVRWVYRATRRHEDPVRMGKIGPRATPTIDQGRVYVVGATGILNCLDGASGELIWSADIPALVGIGQNPATNTLGNDYTVETSTLTWGRSASPLIVGDTVVVPAGGLPRTSQATEGAGKGDASKAKPQTPAVDEADETATMIAFDKATGEERWRGGKRMVSYGSPSLATLGGVQQILLVTEQHAVGHDAATGQELWAFPREGASNGSANCSQLTVVDGDRVLATKGYGLGGELLQINRTDQAAETSTWSAESLRKDRRVMRTKFTNPVLVGGHVYSLSDGFLECVELTDDEPYFRRMWRKRGRFGDGQILAVGDKILVHTEDGELLIVEQNPQEFVELARYPTVEGFCWNTLCVYGEFLIVRSELEAACFRLPLKNENAASSEPLND